MEFWSVRQLRSASAPWGYDAVSKPQLVNRPAFNYKEACRGHGINTAYGKINGLRQANLAQLSYKGEAQ